MFDRDKLIVIFLLLLGVLMLSSCASTPLTLEEIYNLKQGNVNHIQAEKEN